MTVSQEAQELTRQSYDALAPVYDDFTTGYQYERWVGRLLERAEEAGLEGNRLLDVACGTGLSFTPMLDRGWQVTGCDLSPEMLKVARAKVGDAASLVTADMRELPVLGSFDLIWSVNDSLNYLLSTEDFAATVAGMARNLAPGGIIVFDVNTLTTYRTFFSTDHSVEVDGQTLVWKGLMSGKEIAPGSINEARFQGEDPDLTHVHRQRHFTKDEVLAAAAAANLELRGLFGEQLGDLSPGVDEDSDTKSVYVFQESGAARRT